MTYIVSKNEDSFLYRRIIRIVPLYYGMTFFTVTLFLLKPVWFRNVIVTPEAIIKSLLFIPYRIKGSGPILSLGWTLNYEMFFYLTIAISISLFGNKRGMIACLILLSLFVLICQIYPPTNYILAFYSGSIILEFVAGSFLFYHWNARKHSLSLTTKWVGKILGILSLIFLIITDYFYDPTLSRFLLFGIPSLFLTNAALMVEGKVDIKKKLYSTAVLLGDSSYAMYLTHPFIIYAFIRLVFKNFKSENVLFRMTELVVTMIIVCFVSIVIYKWFEKPVMKKLKLATNNKFRREESVKTARV
ncbi:acyltransferase [Dyadobacter sp. CY323]|nr:acyltransferase [Dyadobacter sp. CY323]